MMYRQTILCGPSSLSYRTFILMSKSDEEVEEEHLQPR